MNFEIIINSIIAAVAAAAMVSPSEVETAVLTAPAITTTATTTTTTTETTTTAADVADSETEYTYNKLTKVIEVTECVDMVTVEDYNGKLWYFHGIEDWEIGDACILTIRKYNPECEEDDEIINATYAGWDIGK